MSMGDEEDRKLFVGGLPQDTTQDELKVPVTFRLVFESGFRGLLDPDPFLDFWQDPDSMNMDPKHWFYV